ncbi:pyocin knob domain-containing protein [Achromobacter marplatensis]|uniref:pyocin knob domain-containing protein n=1 Tax=Achromobacter marplatensis TaxID=470868 RepID=UPI0028EE501F|nr:pyocin knob domain-containing protein [Achromobacter marplatensis]
MPTLETINVGQAPNDRTGDQLRTAMQKVILNFSALNTAIQGVLDGKGQASGYASLGTDGRLLAAQAPIVYAPTLPTTTHDLNTYVTPGTFYQAAVAGATAPTGVNYPVAQLGFLEVVATGTPVLQVYTTRAAISQQYWRVRISSSSWSAWAEVLRGSLLASAGGVATLGADSRLLPAQAPIVFTTSLNAVDANSIVTPGVYSNNADASATAALNWPEQLAGTLTVETSAASNAQVTQIYTTRNGTGGVSRTYKRVRFGTGGGTWGTWQQLARFDDAMTHTFLTVATDANTLVADNTFYTWRSGVVVTGGSNWAPVGTNVSGGSLEVRVTAADMIIQTATFLVGSNKPRIYQRFGSGTAWQAWKIISAVSSVTWLPTADAGDVYVDGLGWHSWNGTAYALTSLATVLPTAAHDLNTYTTPGSYRQTTNAGAAAGTNYPSPLSGYLEVVQGVSGSCKQEYTISSASNATLTAGPRKFWRMQTGASAWSPWQEVLTVAMGLTQQTVAAAADANTLSAVNTQYVWTNGVVVNGGTNWPALGWSASRGFLEVVAMSGTQVFQRLVLLLAGATRPVVYERFGSVGGTWYGWRIAGPISSTSYLPTADYGDVYVDGLGWYFWNGTAYVATPLANARVTALESQMFGRGQSWVDMSGQRGGSTNYTNSTGRPIIISLTGVTGADALLLGRVNGILMGRSFIPGSIGGEIGLTFVVPPGDTYRAEWGGINTIFWAEYR